MYDQIEEERMPFDVERFNLAYLRAQDKIRHDPEAAVADVQGGLRALVPADASEHDRTWTMALIEELADPPEPARHWSALYYEAGRISADAYRSGGSAAEQIAVLEEARRQIWAIADRASKDEAPHIRAMTRTLEHLENDLRDPAWPLDDSTGNGG
ncbi:hypothetical protein OG558_41385 [Kribbella sp. NBC_01510]|uniref:hypothetical protein n=1 Tax=Kribbella sp. NBC_01510 TaxID=2903581 RepID=UPI00386D7867